MRFTARGLFLIGAVLLLTLAVSWVLYLWFIEAGDNPMSQFGTQGSDSSQIRDLYNIVFWAAAAVFVIIMAVTLLFSIMFRERPGREALQIHGNSRLEVMWTLIPVIIVAVLAIPSFEVIVDRTGEAPEGALQVIATGNQWWFEFEYPEYDLVTANELHLPVDRPVEILLRSEDVIHSFWVPRLAGKVDMVPGHENRLFFTPLEVREEPYLGQCAEFCGLSHANMRFRVFVREQADFQQWVEQQQQDAQTPEEELAEAGMQIFLSNACVGCHTIEGTAAQAKVGPDLTHVGSRSTIAGAMMANTPENMARWLLDPPDVKPGSLMPDLELTDDQVAKLVAYLESLD